MPSLEIPKRPLPASEIPQYTDEIVISSLGSPVGFNDEQILFNAHRIDQIRRFGGIGVIHITSYCGNASQVHAEAMMLGNGHAAAVGSSSATVAPLQRSTHDSVEDRQYYYARPTSIIALNSSELDRQADTYWKKNARGALDPHVRAAIINKAIKSGLSEQLDTRLLQNNFNVGLMSVAASMHVGFASLYNEKGADVAVTSCTTVQIAHLLHHILDGRAKGYAWGDRLKSALPVVAADRYLAAQALLKTTRLVTAREIPR